MSLCVGGDRRDLGVVVIDLHTEVMEVVFEFADHGGRPRAAHGDSPPVDAVAPGPVARSLGLDPPVEPGTAILGGDSATRRGRYRGRSAGTRSRPRSVGVRARPDCRPSIGAVKLGLGLELYRAKHLDVPLDLVTAADRLGFHSVWTAEAYGADALSPLAFFAAHTPGSSWPRVLSRCRPAHRRRRRCMPDDRPARRR